MPFAVLRHQEGEVLLVVVGVVGENVEHSPAEKFINLWLRNLQLTTGAEELLVTVCVGIDGYQGLHE